MPPSHADLAEHLRYFAELGVEGISRDASWRVRPSGRNESATADESTGGQAESPMVVNPPASTETPPPSRDVLAAIRADLGDCTRCKLHGGRTHLVFGVGNPDADLMFVGEGPGADEDVQGIPFVGRAGQLLTQIIKAMGYERDDVYIANVVKCRPPENRNPEPDEIEQCEPFLMRQIDTIRPKIIVALGKFAVQALLQSKVPITKLRGQWHSYHGIKLMPTFHPAYLLRNPADKKLVWEDIKKVIKEIRGSDA